MDIIDNLINNYNGLSYSTDPIGTINNYHVNLRAFQRFIESVEHGIKSYSEAYFNLSSGAKEKEDLEKQERYCSIGLDYIFNVKQIAYYSIVTSLISLLEDGFNLLCVAHQEKNNYRLKHTDMSGTGIERSINYLEKVCNIKNIKEDSDWEFIYTVRAMRNKIVHAGGKITNKDKKMLCNIEKFEFRMENNKIYFDDLDINEIFKKITNFSQRIIWIND